MSGPYVEGGLPSPARERHGVKDLIEWLRAQLDADEQVAGDIHEDDFCTHISYYSHGEGCDCPWPKWMLADIEAKRQVIAWREAWAFAMSPAPTADLAIRFADQVHATDMILRLLAVPYANRPGYDESWRP